MATSLAIPAVNLPSGDRTFGPISVSDNLTRVQVTIDRSITNGMNSKTSATKLTYHLQVSTDGGVTYPFGGIAGPYPGGSLFGDPEEGSPLLTVDGFSVSLPPSTGRFAKVTITCTNGPVSIAGSLDLT